MKAPWYTVVALHSGFIVCYDVLGYKSLDVQVAVGILAWPEGAAAGWEGLGLQ